MPINVICPNAGCQKRFTVPDNAAGKSATCTNCGTKIAIPAEREEEPEERVSSKKKAAFDTDDDDAPKSRKGRKDDDDRDEDDDDRGGRSKGRPKRRASGGGDSNFVLDLLLLRFALAPILVPALVWLGSFWILIEGLWNSIDMFRFANFFTALRFLVTVLVMPLVLRVMGEVALAILRTSDAVAEVKNNTKKDTPPPPA